MSFLRITTLLAAVVSVVVVVENLVWQVENNRYGFQNARGIQLLEMVSYPVFHLVLAVFFTALFVRQKG